MSDYLKICVDSNEASTQPMILNHLRMAGCEVNIRKLPVCDYVISDRCGIERKNVADFVSSIKDLRLFNQAREISSCYERPILLLEGDLNRVMDRSMIKPSSLYGALSSLTLDFNFSIIPSVNAEHTAILINRLAYREQAENERKVQIRAVKRDMPLHLQQMFLLSGLPKIGPSLAEELLNTFDTPIRVFDEIVKTEVKSSKSGKTKKLIGSLEEVRGMGPSIVESAKKLLTTSFNELKNAK
ncbi:MAG: ERCC4 domain-containing protein [Candidatus Bathyarchaeia archaeon]